MMMTIMQAGIIIVFAEPLKGYLEAKPGKMSSALYSRVSGWGGLMRKCGLLYGEGDVVITLKQITPYASSSHFSTS